MIKKTIINNEVMYVKMRESGLKTDYYFNRKACDNEERGHSVMIDREIEYNRPAPALNVILSCGSPCLNISGSNLIPL